MARILIVDDVLSFREALGFALRKDGHTIAYADDGNDAVRQILNAEQKFDLVLLDYQMPLWDGVESMVLFRTEGVITPVIAYTATHPSKATVFESVMSTLGAVAAVRCGTGCDELLRVTKEFLQKKAA